MLCPKCGFSQPDDFYCANCGVNVDKYAKKKKKKRYQAGIVVAVFIITVLAIAMFFGTQKDTATKDKFAGKTTTRQRSPGTTPGSGNLKYPQPNQMARRPAVKPRRQSPRSAAPGDQPSRQPQSPESSSPAEATQETQPQSTSDRTALAAREWFEKGVSLDDDSDSEIEFYQKAIEQDPRFAPAYYRLGAIYFRQADYDLAEQHFARFLQYASDADRQTYDITVYYSLEDLERPLEGEETEPAPQEGEEQTTAETEEATIAEAGEEATTEETEEVESIIKFAAANGHMVVPVVLNGETNASLLFDTGAGITVLSRELAQSLGLEAEAGRAIQLKTVAAEVQAQVATLDSITLGGLSRTDFQVAVVDLNLVQNQNFEGILGMDFLGNYSIRIDKAANRISLTPR
jgi:clan AA aspartic protease (TIGR02281 family)